MGEKKKRGGADNLHLTRGEKSFVKRGKNFDLQRPNYSYKKQGLLNARPINFVATFRGRSSSKKKKRRTKGAILINVPQDQKEGCRGELYRLGNIGQTKFFGIVSEKFDFGGIPRGL